MSNPEGNNIDEMSPQIICHIDEMKDYISQRFLLFLDRESWQGQLKQKLKLEKSTTNMGKLPQKFGFT